MRSADHAGQLVALRFYTRSCKSNNL